MTTGPTGNDGAHDALIRWCGTDPWHTRTSIQRWRRATQDTTANILAFSTRLVALRPRTAAASERRQRRLFRRLTSLGDRARDARNWFVAAIYYQEALRIDTQKAAYWVQFGHALKESGDPAQAEAAYRRALALEPNNVDTQVNLAHLLKLLDRPEEALTFYASAHALAPDDARIAKAFVALKTSI